MTDQPPAVQRLFTQNARWAKDVSEADRDFFQNSANNIQEPPTLWIGCSDSRVPESVITNSRPGDIFVHRNIANQLHLDDTNVLSVLAFAVDSLEVQHVAVVGHSVCGAAEACLQAVREGQSGPSVGPLRQWLTPLTSLVVELNKECGILDLPEPEAVSTIVEANVRKQVQNLRQTDTIKNARREVTVHGWVYDLATGRLKDLDIPKSQ